MILTGISISPDVLVEGSEKFIGFIGIDTSFVGALPAALMKSLSGSGAHGLMIDTMEKFGVDSFVARTSCVVRGASDTTFYILAVYFGSVG
ncbi:Spore maturation protein B, partial [termite gut metagenome]